MATTEAVLRSVNSRSSFAAEWSTGAGASLALTAVAFGVHGYHPYAEDGGVYLPGIKHLLNPALYPHWTGFVTAHLHYELFAPIAAALVRASGLSLMAVMLLLYLAGIWATLFAGWLVAARCTTSLPGRLGAISVLALALTVPVAGTSLMLMDPYVTARTIATPCALLALVSGLDAMEALRSGTPISWRSIALCCGSLALAALVHPLMAAYGFGSVLLLITCSLPLARARWIATVALCAASFAAAACLNWLSPRMSSAYLRVAETRSYWFLSTWHWYELFGLIAPLILLPLLARISKLPASRDLAKMASTAGLTAIAVALCFAHASNAGSLVARLQPLRMFQIIYALLLLAVGIYLGERMLQRRFVRWAALFAALGPLLYFVQAETFPSSPHVELPGSPPANQWEKGFVWIRNHTPVDSTFAMDANYITAPGEDSQNFRAIAQRSAVPDFSKDGGIASIAPSLAAAWQQGEILQKGLDEDLNGARAAALRNAGVDWVVLTAHTPSSIPCAYANEAMKVCALPR